MLDRLPLDMVLAESLGDETMMTGLSAVKPSFSSKLNLLESILPRRCEVVVDWECMGVVIMRIALCLMVSMCVGVQYFARVLVSMRFYACCLCFKRSIAPGQCLLRSIFPSINPHTMGNCCGGTAKPPPQHVPGGKSIDKNLKTERLSNWKATGVIALRDANLKACCRVVCRVLLHLLSTST